MTDFPDVEVLLIAWCVARRPSAVWVAELDNDLLENLPLGQITRVGGTDDGVRLDRALVDVDAYAATRGDAAELAAWARGSLTRELSGTAFGDAVFGRISVVSAPALRPYENTGLRRIGATYEVFLHPAVT